MVESLSWPDASGHAPALHVVPQFVKPGAQAIPQEKPLQVALPLAGAGQLRQPGPQLAMDCVTHVPLHSCMPFGQMQEPH